MVGSDLLSATSGIPYNNTCSVLYQNFGCADIDTPQSGAWLGAKAKWFKWQIQNHEPTNTYNTSAVAGPNITESAVSVTYLAGNESKVNRSSGISTLSIRIRDTENNTYSNNVNTTFWVTTQNGNWDSGNMVNTNISGTAIYNFTPSCSPYYEAGVQNWTGGVSDACYQDVNLSDWVNTTVYGILSTYLTPIVIPSYSHPPTKAEYLRGSNITIIANFTDECSNLKDVGVVNITAIQNNTETEFQCKNILSQSIGYYNCTFNTSANPSIMPTRWYHVKINGTKQYYNMSSSFNQDAFWIETKPILNNSNYTTSDNVNMGGWGETWIFMTNVTNEDEDLLDVSLWLLKEGQGWQNPYSLLITDNFSTVTAIGPLAFTADDRGNWSYMWNVTEINGTDAYTGEADVWNDTTSISNITLINDDVSIVCKRGCNGVLNRTNASDIVTFKAEVDDSDRNQVIATVTDSGSIYVTSNEDTELLNSSQYQWVTDISELGTDSGGFIQWDFPTLTRCTYLIGPQKWRVEFIADGWKPTNSSFFNVTLTTNPLTVAIASTKYNYSIRRGDDPIPFSGNVSDDCGLLTNASVQFSVPEQNARFINTSNNAWYNYSVYPQNHSSWNYGVHNLTINASKKYYNGSATAWEYSSFRILTNPRAYNPTASSRATGIGASDGGWGEVWTFNVTVVDLDQIESGLNEVLNITLWLNTSNGWRIANSTTCIGTCQTPQVMRFVQTNDFSCNDVSSLQGPIFYQFNVTDAYGYNNETNSTINLQKDSVFVQFVSDPLSINRESGVGLFSMRAMDTDISDSWLGSGVSTRFWFTTNGASYDELYSNTTNLSGSSIYSFDPGCSINATTQRWKAGTYNDVCYENRNFTIPFTQYSFDVYGNIRDYLVSPAANQTYAVGDSVSVRMNATSDCGYGISNLSVIWIQDTNPNNQTGNCSATINDEGEGYYNCTWDTSFHVGGWYDLRMQANKSYYYSNLTVWNDWVYLNNTAPTAGNFSVTPTFEGWGKTYSFYSDVYDAQRENVTCKIYVSTNNQSTWAVKNQTILNTLSGNGNAVCNLTVSNFGCSDIGTDNYFKFELSDGTNILNTTINGGPNITRDDAYIEYISGNNTLVNRAGINTTLLVARIYDVDRNNLTVSGINGTFWITRDLVNFQTQQITQTNSSGYLNYSFDPGCSPKYEVAKQYWFAGINDACYTLMNLSVNYSLNITGDLVSEVAYVYNDQDPFSPPINVTKGEQNVTIDSIIKDECGTEQEGANVIIYLMNVSGYQYPCDPVEYQGSGIYRCMENTSYMSAKWYSVIINATRPFMNPQYVEENNIFYIQTRPLLTDLQCLNCPRGWGETFSFNVTISDEDEDNVTLELFVQKPNSGAWVKREEINLIAPIVNRQVTLNSSAGFFECPTNLGIGGFRFDATDSRFLTRSEVNNLTVERDDIEIIHSSGNNGLWWRNGTHTLLLSLLVRDTDRDLSLGAGQDGTFRVTKNGAETFDSGKTEFTNESGYLNYEFTEDFLPEPICNYSLGVQTWNAGVNGICYKEKYSSNYSMTRKSVLKPVIIMPNGEGYIRGGNIPLIGRVEDECSNSTYGVENTTVIYRLDSGSNVYICTLDTNNGWQENGGSYNCSWNSASRSTGYYNLMMNSTKGFYEDNFTYRTNSFHLGNMPKLFDPSVDHSSGGWGETYTFSVLAADADFQWINVSLWGSYDNSTWYMLNITSVRGINRTVNFQNRFWCGNMSTNADTGIKYFKFTVYDPYNYSDETIPKSINLTYDDVTASVTTNTTYNVRRVGQSATLEFRIRDTDMTGIPSGNRYGEYPSGASGNMWITQNTSDYSFYYTCTSNGGYCNRTYDPSCNSTVGIQNWTGGVMDSCYLPINSSRTNLQVFGQLYPIITNPFSGKIINRNTTTYFNATIVDDCDAVISPAVSRWYNDTLNFIALGNNTAWNVSALYDLGAEIIRINSTQQYYDNGTNSSSIYVYGWAEVRNIIPLNGTKFYSGSYVESICTIRDANTEQPISGYSVSFYKNDTLQNISITDSNGNATWTWYTLSDPDGLYNVSCNISSSIGLYYNVSLAVNSTIIEIERPLRITEISKDNSNIFRNDSFNPHYSNLTIKVVEASLGASQNANVSFYNQTAGYLGYCITNSRGKCSFIFNATDDVTPDIYTLYFNATKTGTKSSSTNVTTVKVMSVAYGSITEPVNGSEFPKNDIISLSVDVWDENNNTFTATVKWYNETAQVASGMSTILVLNSQNTGWRNITSLITRNCLNDSSQLCSSTGTSEVFILVRSLSDVGFIYPLANSNVTILQKFNATCRVYDDSTSQAIPNYPVKMWYTPTGGAYNYLGEFFTNGSGDATYEYYPLIKGNLTFKCNITDNQTLQYATNIYESESTFNVRDTLPPLINYTLIEPYQRIEANYNYTNITASIIDEIGINAAWAQIKLPNGTLANVTLEKYPNIITYRIIENASVSTSAGFTYMENISDYGIMHYFNITIYNSGNETFYFNLTVNDIAVAYNQPAVNGTNTTLNAIYNSSSFGAPDNYTIKVGVMNASGYNLNLSYISFMNYRVNVTRYVGKYIPPIGGTYNVTVFAQDLMPEGNINSINAGQIYVWGTSSSGLANIPSQQIASGITQTGNYSFNLTLNFSNLGPATAYSVNITVFDNSNYTVYSSNLTNCGNVSANSSCTMKLNITLNPATPPVVITVYSFAVWSNADKTSQNVQNLTNILVSENPVVDILESDITNNATHDDTTLVGNITILSHGNAEITDVALQTLGGNLALDCPLCNVQFIPNETGLLLAGENISSNIYLTVPAGQAPGVYWSKIRVTTSNAGYDEILLNITIPLNNTWIRRHNSNLGVILAPLNTSGGVGTMQIKNLGNVRLTFNLYRSEAAAPLISLQTPTFDLQKLVERNVSINFSVAAGTTPGLYYGRILSMVRDENTNTAYPTDISSGQIAVINFTLNVTDIPPTISDANVTPTSFEVIYDTVNVSANITDNFAVGIAWINVTMPNGMTYSERMNKSGNTYSTNYNTSIPGVHQVRICANDTQELEVCGSIINVTASENTTVLASPNSTVITLRNISLSDGQNFSISIDVNNTGYSRAFGVNLTIDNISNWYSEPYFFGIGTLLKQQSYTNITSIFVPAGLYPGNYSINFTTNWTNLNGINDVNTTNLTVRVLSNPLLDVLENSMNMTVYTGGWNTQNFTLSSIGNDNATSINFSCSSGAVCNNFTVEFNPMNLSYLSAGAWDSIRVNVSVPVNFPTGSYYGVISAIAARNVLTSVPIHVAIPVNISWEQTPLIITREVVAGKTGPFGDVKIINTGNVPLIAELLTYGNASAYLGLNVSSPLSIGAGETSFIGISFDAPAPSMKTNYIGYLATINNSAVISQQTTTLNLTVHPFFANITSPTEAKPKINVSGGDVINASVNITYRGVILSDSIVFNVMLQNSTFSTNASIIAASYSLANRLWLVNFTAPNLASGHAYDLNITANYTLQKIAYFDVENSSIIYIDNTPPFVDIDVPTDVPGNTTAFISINATDSGGIKNVTANLTDPQNATSSLIVLNFSYRDGNIYVYDFGFTNTTLVGIYKITARACDISGNCNFSTSQFGVFPRLWFVGRTVNEEDPLKPAIVVNFVFYEAGTNTVIYNFSSNALGYYNQSLQVRTYDLVFTLFNDTIKMFNVTLDSDLYNPIVFGKIPLALIGDGSIKGITYTTVINSSLGKIEFSLSQCLIYGECGSLTGLTIDNLGIYTCNGWVRYNGCRNSTWQRGGGVFENGTKSIYYYYGDNSSIAGTWTFSAAKYICGNGVCEELTGESTATCPRDCPGGGGAGAGGGAGGGGAGGGGGGGAEGGGGGGGKKGETGPIQINVPVIDITIYPGETKIFAVEITNTKGTSIDGTLSVEGPVWKIIELQKSEFVVANKMTESIQVKVSPDAKTLPGIYTGDLIIDAGGEKRRVPITVAVEILQEPLLDVVIKMLTNKVRPGDDLKFEISVVNMGGTTTVEDVVLNYSLRNLEFENITLSSSEETIAVSDVSTFKKTIKIPTSAISGKYLVDVKARYWYARKHASASESFDIYVDVPPMAMLKKLFSAWITWIIFFLVLPLIYFGIKLYGKYRLERMKKSRYIMPSFETLPKDGETAMDLGKIAETDKKAFFDMDDLTTHLIAAGTTGSGKTVSAMVLAEEILRKNRSVVVFDPTAQWTGFLAPNKDKKMFEMYKKFGLKKEDTRAFKGMILDITDPKQEIDIRDYLKPGEITVFTLNRLTTEQFDVAVRNIIGAIFKQHWEESSGLKVLVVFDEVHRLLEKYGGKGGYTALEKACREFRKWGIGIMMISQILGDFKDAVKGNILTEIQLHTKGEEDIERVRKKYGDSYAERLTKQQIGVGLMQNPKYNGGKPWFVNFRPLLHSPHKLFEEELETYKKLGAEIVSMKKKVKDMQEKKIETRDLELELKLAEDKLKVGSFKMVEIYLEGLRRRFQ
ncbi:MAG: DUF87 domain-containing protein [archaeon]